MISQNLKSNIIAIISTIGLITFSLVCILSMEHLNTAIQYYPHF